MSKHSLPGYEYLPIGIVFVQQGVILKYNSHFETIIGYQKPLLGVNILEIIEHPMVEESDPLLFDNESDIDASFQLKDQNKWIRIRSKLENRRSGDLTIYVVEDVTKTHVKELIYDKLFNRSIESNQSIVEIMVQTMSDLMKVKYCSIGIFNEKCNEVAIRAICVDNKLEEPFSYSMEGTPCKDVFFKGRMIVKSGARERFPSDIYFVDKGIESYIGIALKDNSGRNIAHLVVMDNHPIQDEDMVLSILDMYANRLSTEIEKEIKEIELKKQNEVLSDYAFSNSHKVRAPLANLIGLSNLMGNTDFPPEELKDLTAKIETEAKKLDEILREVNHKLSEYSESNKINLNRKRESG